MKISSALTALAATIIFTIGMDEASAAPPALSLSLTPAGPGGISTATVALGDVSDVESFSLLLDLGSGTGLQLPSGAWFTRGPLVPSSLFGSSTPVELNNIFESSTRTKVYLYSFKPTGTNGTVATVKLQVPPSSLPGTTQQVTLTGEYFSKSGLKVNPLAPKTSAFTVTNSASYLLSVTLAGTGGGAVNSNPTGIACTSGTCQSSFPQNSVVYLMPSPDSNSVFSGWSGCAGSGNCSVTMDANKAVTATFAGVPYLRVGGANYTFFSSLQQALQTAAANSTIEGRSVTLLEQIIFNRPDVSLKLRGGFDTHFTTRPGMTKVKGKLVIRDGSLRVERMVVQ